MSYPPQQGPPTAYMPPPPEPKKGKKAAGCLGIGCGGLVLIAIIGGIAAAVGGGKGSSDSPSTVAAAPAAAATSSAAAPATSKKAAAPKAPAAPAKPHVLLNIKGNGIKNSAKFTTGDDWTIHYTYNCSNFGSAGNFTVYVDYPSGDIPVNELGKKGSDTSTSSGAGTHTLKIASECSWSLLVTDG